jgi:hypothetical protein
VGWTMILRLRLQLMVTIRHVLRESSYRKNFLLSLALQRPALGLWTYPGLDHRSDGHAAEEDVHAMSSQVWNLFRVLEDAESTRQLARIKTTQVISSATRDEKTLCPLI